MGWFNGWFGTRWYALLYSHRNEEDAEALVKPLINKGKLRPGQSVLDMACGRGRHAAIFAREGMEVTGIDISSESIDIAKRTVPGARFMVHDIREPIARNAFDSAVCLFTSLGYSDDREDDHKAVRAAAAALKPRGLFVLDLLNGRQVAQCLVPVETRVVEGVRFDIRRAMRGRDIVKQIKVTHGGATEEYEECVHAWTRPEVEEMILDAGLTLEDVTDETCLRAFDGERSKRIVAWARKDT